MDKSLRRMYQTVKKKKGVAYPFMIILMNHKPFRELYTLFQQEAYSPRVIIHNPKSPFIFNLTPFNNTACPFSN